jgi:ATP-binding cassette subfamily G (WHITE) protein 2 (SNQ2)
VLSLRKDPKADPDERKYQPGRSAEDDPSTPAALAQAFKNSKHYASLQFNREEYNKLMETEKHDQDSFRKAVAEDKNRHVSRNSPYTVSFWKQVAVLTSRQFRLQSQDHFGLVTSYGMSIVSQNGLNQCFSKITITYRLWQ